MELNRKRSKSRHKKSKFILDCHNTNSRLREYNGLWDPNLAGFFST